MNYSSLAFLLFLLKFCAIVPRSGSLEFPSFFGTGKSQNEQVSPIPSGTGVANNSRFGVLSDMIIESFTTTGNDDGSEDEYYDEAEDGNSEYGYTGPGGLGVPAEFNPQEGFEGALVPNTWYGLVPYGIEGTVVVITAIIMLGITLIGFGFLIAWACGIQKYFPLIIKPKIEVEDVIITTTPAPFLLGLLNKPNKPFKPFKPPKPLFSKPGLLGMGNVVDGIQKLETKYSESNESELDE